MDEGNNNLEIFVIKSRLWHSILTPRVRTVTGPTGLREQRGGGSAVITCYLNRVLKMKL